MTPAASRSWTGTATALSSIAHGGDTRGTITLLRRERVRQVDGRMLHVPVVSGNALRGRLRRIGEELLRDAVRYEGKIPLSAAHALRGGGSLAKVSTAPLSGRRLQQLRALVPQVGVFGCAGGGRIIDGCLQVGKLVPLLRETAHITGHASDLDAFEATQLETYTRSDDSDGHCFAEVTNAARVPLDADGQPQLDELPAGGESRHMLFRVETFPAGTQFHTWLQLDWASELEAAFFADVLDAFAARARVGGRGGIGHGRLALNLAPEGPAVELVDWRGQLAESRDEVLDALSALT